MADDFGGAVDRLTAKLKQHEDQARKTKLAINAIYEAFEQAPPYPDAEDSTSVSSSIRSDQFYGQPLATCIRGLLEARKAANRGPATVNEIYDALKAGGYAFDAKDDDNAKRSLRINLTKNQVTFHRLPGGQWGMLSWYPNAKPPKEDEEADEKPTATKESTKVASPDVATKVAPAPCNVP